MKIANFYFAGATLALSALFAASPAWANQDTVESDSTNLGAFLYNYANGAETSAESNALQNGTTTGLTWLPVVAGAYGTFTPVPAGAPLTAEVIQVPPAPPTDPNMGYDGNSGFVESTFILPAGFTNASLDGYGNADDNGYVFLNGNSLGVTLGEFSNTEFSTIDQAYFQAGTNTLLIADENNSGPGGVAYYANITFDPPVASPVPEPGSLLLLGSGLLALGRRMVRRRIA